MSHKWISCPQEAGDVMPKVLIVDDSPSQLYCLRKLVEQAGHQAVVAESGEQALQVAAAEHPAVILMDIVMPGMSGYQATRKLGRTESTRHRASTYGSASGSWWACWYASASRSTSACSWHRRWG